MSFFSGLKAAYGTLESELSKTFDSKAGESSTSVKEEVEEVTGNTQRSFR